MRRGASESEARERAGQAAYEAMGWRPEEPYHLFRLDITEAAYLVFGAEAPRVAAEAEAPGVSSRLMQGDGGESSPGHAVIHWKA